MREVRPLLSLAWPVVLGNLGLVAMGVIDLVVAGSLGEASLAAVGLGHTWSFGTLVFGLGVASGVDPQVTRAYGAGRPREAGVAALHGAALLGLVGLGIAALHLVAGPVLTLFQQPADAVPGAALYCQVLTLGVPPYLGFVLVRQLLQGGGSMRPAAWVALGGNLVNLAADAVLVYGLGYGVGGVAWATVVVRWFMLLALVALGWPILREAWPGWVIERARVARLAPIALPVGWQIGFEVWAFNAATLLAGLLGTSAMAAHTAALNAAALAFMVPMGLSAAATTRVGNHLGAGRPWTTAGWTAIALGSVSMGLSGLLFVGAPETVMALYRAEPPVVALGLTILPIAAFFGFFDGIQVVAMGVLRGVGDTRVAAWIALVAYWGVGLPVSAALLGQGLAGVWLGLSAGLATAASLGVARVAWLASGRGMPVLDESV
ncbi:MAG: MATE family efflux transporter [Alphaproteobacteria bacterium]|nr:MATE family efflux transporter [Alphaproteobacteria bacterium]